jgi:hypothetical protein
VASVAEELIHRGANINACNSSGKTRLLAGPLHSCQAYLGFEANIAHDTHT